MLDITEYPYSFYSKVFDLFIKYFDVNPEDKERFILDYLSGPDGPAYIISKESVCIYFHVPGGEDDLYPSLDPDTFSKFLSFESMALVNLVNEEIKQLAIRCIKCKAFL